MLAAPVVAFVRAGGPALLRPLAVAVVTATPEFPVKRVLKLTGHLGERLGADQRPDVVRGQGPVIVFRLLFNVQLVEVPIKELVHRRLGARAATIVHLGEEAGPDLLRLLHCLGPRRDRLGEVHPLAREGVETGVHADPQRPAGERLDLAALGA